MDKTISYVMNTVVGEITSISEFMNIVSDYDYCQFGIDRGEGDFFFFELKIKELYNKGNKYVQSLYDESDSGWDMDRFAEDYINGVEECTSLFEDDDNWNFKVIHLNDKGNNKQQLKGLLSAMYIEDEITDMIENNIDTARYYAAQELFYEWVENL